MAEEPALVACAARCAISDIIHLYCHAIDRRRWDLLDHCFHTDASYQFGHIEGGWRDFVAIARTTIDPSPATHHQTGNILFRIEGDRATTETYFTAWHRVSATALPTDPFPGTGADYDIVIAGRYIDHFERRAGDWRIARRTGVTDWRRDGPAADAGLFALPAAWRGSVGDGDPGRAVIEA